MSAPVLSYPPSILSLGGNVGMMAGALTGGSTPGSLVYPVANDAILVPFYLQQNTLIKRLFWANGNANSGNVDMGIYTADGAKIITTGSTAQSGSLVPQFVDVTDFLLSPGGYYFALSCNNTTATFLRSSVPFRNLRTIGVLKMASAFPLPATLTFAPATDAYLPLMGAEVFRVL